MKLLFALLLSLPLSIYDIAFTDTAGNNVSMGTFQNKMILVVNIATSSPRVDQLAALQQLKQQFGDSLAIIGFLSNSFGNEPLTDLQINQFCATNYGVNFPLASKHPVTGSEKQALYSWLADPMQNGVMSTLPLGDFQKYLFNKGGQIIGVFAPSVSPMDSLIIHAITDNQ